MNLSLKMPYGDGNLLVYILISLMGVDPSLKTYPREIIGHSWRLRINDFLTEMYAFSLSNGRGSKPQNASRRDYWTPTGASESMNVLLKCIHSRKFNGVDLNLKAQLAPQNQ